ncbi:hypothetical protein Acor_37110 [Acrocarpospora corrugata]|uniref:Tetratricopeptide repeat protein n=1 Tax=Acrocarpospora corrugata TaxID=35763 RepID=A0A5M3VXP7_9ACTN|nr:hypothetical protein [Acrocarpospora corrugata]GES01647.1 hypothetical protein Acor_37110 [Acrocarpospora corrugata]
MSDELGHVIDLCDRGSFSEVSAFVGHLSAERPGEPFPILLDALVHARQAEAATARELIDHAMLLSSPSSDCLALASMIFRELGDTTQAILYGLRATNLNPQDWRGHVALARAAAANHRHEAERAARRAIGLAPDEASAHLALGEALLAYVPGRKHARAEAVAALEHAAELDPDNTGIQKALAKARPGKEISARLGCLTLLALIAAYVAARVLFEKAGDGVALLLGNEPDSEHSAQGLLIIAAIAALIWGLVRLIRVNIRAKRRGDRLIVAIGRRRELSRALHLADEESLRIKATDAAAAFCLMPILLTGFLAANAADGTPQPTYVALLSLVGVIGLSIIGWWAVRWWFGPRTLQRALRTSRILSACLLISYLIMIGTTLLSWAEVTDKTLWIALMVLYCAWFLAGLGPIILAERLKRRRGRSGHGFTSAAG